MSSAAIQDFYPDDTSHCFGCGRLNSEGYHLKTRWNPQHPDETIAEFVPRSYHTAIPGFVYGGLVASLIDCHGTGSAAAAGYRAEAREPGTEPPLRYVTASLKVDYLKPTPLGPPLVLRGRIAEVKGRKVVTDVSFSVEGVETARGQVVAVRLPDTMA